MRAELLVGVGIEDALQMGFAKDDHVVQALSPDRADDAFNIAVLPR